MTTSDVGEKWSNSLRYSGYEPPKVDAAYLRRLGRGTRVWRRLFKLLDVKPGATFFELGCGGGAHLAVLGYTGYPCAGIDVSAEVLDRCREYLRRIEEVAHRKLPIDLLHGDFLSYESSSRYDVVFNFGVIEHFIDDAQRLEVLRRMYALARPGGYIVSVVPNGVHPLREEQKRRRLGGYDVPEIDYDDAIARTELRAVGAVDARVYPHALFGYKLWGAAPSKAGRVFDRAAWTAGQALPPLRAPFFYTHAGSLIIVGRRAA